MLALAGRFADGWYPNWIDTPEDYAAKLATIRHAAREAGRDPSALQPGMQAPLVLAPTERAVESVLRHPALRLTGLLRPASDWQALGLVHPFGERFRGYLDFVPERLSPETLRAALRAVPPELVARSVLAGTPEQVTARLRAYQEAGLRFLAVLPASALRSPGAALWTFLALRRVRNALER
jgi:phthiodiolone/phenolphthiodiolone dimycocerosates ketoreductase